MTEKKFRMLTDEETANGAELWIATGGQCPIVLDASPYSDNDPEGRFQRTRVSGVLVGAEDIHDEFDQWQKMIVHVQVGDRIFAFSDLKLKLKIEALVPVNTKENDAEDSH